jgi:hypothetical protein
MVLQGLKPRIFNKLNKHGKKWAAELPSVLWSLRTMPSQATVLKPRTYKLSNDKGKTFTNAWNIEQLRRFYP